MDSDTLNDLKIFHYMSFLLAILSFINFCCNFNLDFLCLVGVASVAYSGVGSVATFGVGFAAVSAIFSVG